MSFKREFGLILVASLIFISSFMWKDLFKDIEEEYFPKEQGIFNRILFTVIVTAILILLAVYLKDIWQLNKEKSITSQTLQLDDDPIGSDGDSITSSSSSD